MWEGSSFSAREEDGTGSDPFGPSASLRYDVSVPVPAGSDGVLVLPWHAGTRPPAPAVPAGRGAVLGLGLGHGGAHIVSAAVEAVCFQLAGGLSDLELSAGQQSRAASSPAGQVPGNVPMEVVVNGGAVEGSRWWKERLAAALARPVLCSSVPETTARGAAADALRVELGARGIEGEIVEPVPADVETLAAARRLWSEYYEVLLPIVTRRSL